MEKLTSDDNPAATWISQANEIFEKLPSWLVEMAESVQELKSPAFEESRMISFLPNKVFDLKQRFDDSIDIYSSISTRVANINKCGHRAEDVDQPLSRFPIAIETSELGGIIFLSCEATAISSSSDSLPIMPETGATESDYHKEFQHAFSAVSTSFSSSTVKDAEKNNNYYHGNESSINFDKYINDNYDENLIAESKLNGCKYDENKYTDFSLANIKTSIADYNHDHNSRECGISSSSSSVEKTSVDSEQYLLNSTSPEIQNKDIVSLEKSPLDGSVVVDLCNAKGNGSRILFPNRQKEINADNDSSLSSAKLSRTPVDLPLQRTINNRQHNLSGGSDVRLNLPIGVIKRQQDYLAGVASRENIRAVDCISADVKEGRSIKIGTELRVETKPSLNLTSRAIGVIEGTVGDCDRVLTARRRKVESS